MADIHTNLADFLLLAAKRAPDSIAVESETNCYTYAQLARMTVSVQLVLHRALVRCCSELCHLGRDDEEEGEEGRVQEDETVPYHSRRPDEHIICIVLERGPECLAAIHAAMLEGCAYNTFDVAEPREKLRTWVEIARHPVMITSQPIMNRLGLLAHGWSMGGEFPRFVLDVDEALRKGAGRQVALPEPAARKGDLDRLCYVIFTSGSTGAPKAVMAEHRSACNLVRVWSDFVGVRVEDRLAQMASMAFDNHVPEVYGAMHKLCTSVVVPDLMKRSGPDMVSWLANKHVSVVVTVPSHLRSMSGPGTDVSVAALPKLRVLDIGGEALGRDVLDTWAPGRCMFNIYGPTEITVVCAGTRVRPGDDITIGHDLPTYRSHVLDPETMKECPIGARGVLYTGGIGVARGYLDDEAKTSGKFVEVHGFGRMYCSGDVVSRDEHGRIHYHGRADWQVKVRGIRIELESLEEAISNLPGVKHCEARVIADGSQLALLASGVGLSEATMKAAAAKLGKGYQLNVVRLVEQSAWKFNTSGKLVRNHVPLNVPSAEDQATVVQQEPQNWEDWTEVEQEIARCVAQLVSTTVWGRESHFIEELGLDSAGFGKLITLLRRKPDLQTADLPLLFEHPSVALLAAAIEARKRIQNSAVDDAEYENVPVGSTGDPLLELLLGRLGSEEAHALCVQTDAEALTYAQLLQRAKCQQSALQRGLAAAGARPEGAERVVLLLLDQSVDLLVSMVAVLLERCAFCISSPQVEKDELAMALALLKPCAVVVEADSKALRQDLAGLLPPSCPTVTVTSDASAASQGPKEWLRRPIASAPFCCVTVARRQGSQQVRTWQPEAVSWAALSWQAHLKLGGNDRVAHLFAPDLQECSVTMWAVLAAGSAILIPPAGTLPGMGLRTWLRNQHVSVLCAQPMPLRRLGAAGGCSALPCLRHVWAAGSHCPGDLASNWARGRHFTFAYTMPDVAAACVFDVPPERPLFQGCRLPLGKPLPGCQLLALGADLEPAPANIPGSLFISCPALSSGQLGQSKEVHLLAHSVGGVRAAATGLAAMQDAAGDIVVGTLAEARSWKSGNAIPRPPTNTSFSVLSVGTTGTAKATPQAMSCRHQHGSSPSVKSFQGYLIQTAGNAEGGEYGDDALPRLCFCVQTVVIFSELLLGAVKLVIVERVLGPYALYADIHWVLLAFAAASYAQRVLGVVLAITLKWLLIGRYREGDHAIYSMFYLKHWLVDRLASASLFGGGSAQEGWNFSLGANFFRMLALKALGADVSLSSMITAPVAGFDLISVGELGSVHGPFHLTSISYVGKRMLLGRVKIGRSATVCHRSCVGSNAVVADGVFVEPMSTVPDGTVAVGHWGGVPGRQVTPSRLAADFDENSSCVGPAMSAARARQLTIAGALLAFLIPLKQPVQMLSAYISLAITRMLVIHFNGADWHDGQDVDQLPTVMEDNLWALPLVALGFGFLQVVMKLLLPLLVCRLSPRIRAPMDVPLYHWKSMLAGFKLFQATSASQELGDASIQAAYLRWCGASVGKGSALSEQTLLPDTLSLGRQCFLASGNTLTSTTVSLGRMRIPCTTDLGDLCFLGNENHVAEGLRDQCFVGLRTWVPRLPEQGSSLFGNPAMLFKRRALTFEAKEDSTCWQRAWHHFSTSVIDLFFWRMLYAACSGCGFVIGRYLYPKYTEHWHREFVIEVLLFAKVSFLTWFLMSIVFCNCIYNDRMPLSAPYYSTVITRWFSANKIRRVFKKPFNTSGSFWDAPVMRLMGVHVGKRFFSPNVEVMVDPIFGRLGDDITVDYDGQVRQHSFEDNLLKWGPFQIGNGTNIGHAAMVAMSACEQDVSLLRGSVTWKGQVLQPGAHEGAPASPVEESAAV